MVQLLSILYKVYFFLLFATSLLLLYPVFYWALGRKTKHLDFAFRLKKIWAKFLFYGSFNSLEKEMNSSGEGVKIYCPNHSSYLDIIVCYLVIPHKFLFLGKAELLRWPLFRIFFKHMDIAVNRGNKLQAARSVVQCGKALKTGWSLVIFPEGTISKKAPELFPFKPGAFKIAEQFNVDIVPVSFVGNWRVLNVSHWNSKSLPGRIQAFVHNKLTLPSDLDLSAKREALKLAIESKLSWK